MYRQNGADPALRQVRLLLDEPVHEGSLLRGACLIDRIFYLFLSRGFPRFVLQHTSPVLLLFFVFCLRISDFFFF